VRTLLPLLLACITMQSIAQPLARKRDLPLERIDGVELRYGEALTEKGYRVRTYTSRPQGAAGRLPLVVFIPWLSCDPVENPRNQPDGWSLMLRVVMRESGAQVVRIEKPGVGDSEGPDCSKTDLEDDMAAFRAGIRGALADPGADPQRLILFGGSVGMALVPILAQEFKPLAIVAAGGFTRTWLEHMLDIALGVLRQDRGLRRHSNLRVRQLQHFAHPRHVPARRSEDMPEQRVESRVCGIGGLGQHD